MRARKRVWIGVCAAVAWPSMASGHPSTDPITPSNAWHAMTFEPAVIVLLAAAALAYAIGRRRMVVRAGPRRRIGSLEAAAFWTGWATVLIALVSPLDAIAGALFSAHMIQHELLMIVAAPLIVLGSADGVFLAAMPSRWRRRLLHDVRSRGRYRAWIAWLAAPTAAWLLHAAAICVWHVPQLFDAAVRSDTVHAAQHASFFGSALVFWWAIVRHRGGRAGYGAAIVSVFTTAVYTSALGALLTISPRVWYGVYAQTTGVWGLSPLEDQQLGGLVMWVPAGVIYTGIGLGLFAAWLRDSDRPPPRVIRGRSLVLPALFLACAAAGAGCRSDVYRQAAAMTGGDPGQGREALAKYGCVTCHTIPGVRAARGLVGPPLTQIASRVYLAGHLPNTPDNITTWIRHPRAINPETAMPDTGVTESDARNIAAYLYTLR